MTVLKLFVDEALARIKTAKDELFKRTNVYTHSPEWMLRIKDKALELYHLYNGRVGEYNHNEVKSIMSGLMAELALRETYRYYGIKARMNMTATQPDLTIPPIQTLDGLSVEHHEEVKSWQHYNWDKFGGTIRLKHAQKYLDKDRKRVWFCSVDVESGTVVINGWLTPAEIMECDIITTGGRYGGENYNCEVLHRASEVFPKMNEADVGGAWW